MSHPYPKEPLPALADVIDTITTPDGLPNGYLSTPDGPGGVVELVDVENVRLFALTYRGWSPTQRKSARYFAKNLYHAYQIQSTLTDFADVLTDTQKVALSLGLGRSEVFQSGVNPKILAFPALDAYSNTIADAGAFAGATGDYPGILIADVKAVCFAQLIRDVRAGVDLVKSVP